jgi:hypothetical protein
MSTEDPTQPGLRVGGWLPPFREFLSESDPGPAVPRIEAAPAAQLEASPAVAAGARHVRPGTGPLVCATVVAVAVAGLTMTFLRDPGSEAAVPNGVRFSSGPVLPAIPFDPADATPTATPPSTIQVTAARRTDPEPAITWTRTGAKSPTTAPGRPPHRPGPQVGATVGLEPDGRPGYRVRHRDFLGRVDRIEPASSALDKADSRFTVRAGLADRNCFSLESVNYPHRFLRHRNFVIHLERNDGTALFAADATFCVVSKLQGAAVSLRSYNYPDRFVVERDSALSLPRTPAVSATAFIVRPPL